MKPHSLVCLTPYLAVGVLFVSSAMLNAQTRKDPRTQMKDAVTNEQLQKQFEKAATTNPLQKMKVTKLEGPDPTKVKPEDLLKTSDFLSFNGFSTLIPKRALLHVPKRYQDRVKFTRGSKLVIWPQFYRGNRGWIKTIEVTRKQAEGAEAFDEQVAENLKKSAIVVVATYKGGPISVLPYKDPEEEAAKEKEKLNEENSTEEKPEE